MWLLTAALPHYISIPKRRSIGFTRGIMFGFVMGAIFVFAVVAFAFWLIGRIFHGVFGGGAP